MNTAEHVITCEGCGEAIPAGQRADVTCESRGHVITVAAHDTAVCRDAAYRATMARRDWKGDPTYLAY